MKRSVVAADIAYQVHTKKYEDQFTAWKTADDNLAEFARQEVNSMLYFEHGWLCKLEGIYNLINYCGLIPFLLAGTGRDHNNLRRKYIPEAVFMLHKILHETRRYKSWYAKVLTVIDFCLISL